MRENSDNFGRDPITVREVISIGLVMAAILGTMLVPLYFIVRLIVWWLA